MAFETSVDHGANKGFDHSVNSDSDVERDSLPSYDVQDGLKKVEATAITWSRTSLILVYIAIFVVFFINSLQQQMSSNLLAYVTSSFALHSLTATTSVVSGIISGVVRLPLAKLLDVWGRPQGYLIMVAIATIGVVLMAACKNVETYAAAQTFYWTGFNGMAYVLDVFIADTTHLKNRGLIFAFSTTPYIATTFAGPALAQSFIDHSTWQWGYGTFAILTPVIAAPVVIVFIINEHKAKKLGLLNKQPSGRTFMQSLKHYAIEFDLIGVILITAGFSLFLLPFSLATSQTNRWQSADVITMIIIGGILLIVFAVYEKFWAIKSFVPFELLKDRTVLCACILAGTLFISFYCWDLYFSSYLQVVWGLSVKNAGYVANTYNIGSCFWGVIVGFVLRRTGRFKWLALAALPVMILGVGLMIHFRQPGVKIGYVVMCQIFIAFAGGTLVICEEVAVMAAGHHQNVAVLLALLALFTSVGQAIGNSIAGAIWTNVIPGELYKALPDDSKHLAATLYASITTQLTYPMGSPVRDAIIQAYGVAQKDMCIAATGVLAIAVAAVLCWKDIDVRKVKQVKGLVV